MITFPELPAAAITEDGAPGLRGSPEHPGVIVSLKDTSSTVEASAAFRNVHSNSQLASSARFTRNLRDFNLLRLPPFDGAARV